MSRQLRETTTRDLDRIAAAVALARDAHALLVEAGALTAARRIAAAGKSAEGALRHADRAYHRTGDERHEPQPVAFSALALARRMCDVNDSHLEDQYMDWDEIEPVWRWAYAIRTCGEKEGTTRATSAG